MLLMLLLQIQRNHSAYVRKHIYPRVFHICNTKRSGFLDFEEYLCAVAVFRLGTIEDKIKCAIGALLLHLYSLSFTLN